MASHNSGRTARRLTVSLPGRTSWGWGRAARRRSLGRRLRAAVSDVDEQGVLKPVEAERERLEAARRALAEVTQQR